MEETYTIIGLNCAHCGSKIEEAINKLDEIESAVLNFPMKTLKIKGTISDDTLEKINKTAGKIEAGVKIVPKDKTSAIKHVHKHNHEHSECCCGHCHEQHSHEHEHDHSHSHSKNESHSGEIISFIIGAAIFAAAVISGKILDIKPMTLVLYAGAYLILGYRILLATFKNIRTKNFFDENTLMTIATLGAFALGEYSEAVGVVLFFKIGEMFEDYAVFRSRKAITDIAELRVDEADVLRDGEYKRIPADEIKIGDILRIKAGERIAADGIVESGSPKIDTSAVNGEPVPVTMNNGAMP